MPLYEYACESCGETFEVLQRMNDTPLATCGAHCRVAGDGGGAVHKVLSAHNVGASNPFRTGGVTSQGPSCGTCGKAGPGCS